MRTLFRLATVALLLGAPLAAQDGGTSYVNKELGLTFSGVYGWEKKFAAGSGAWTELAVYSDAAFDATVNLLVRDNPYETTGDLRKALEAEFKDIGEPKAGQPTFKEVALSEAAMRKGLELPALQAEAYEVRIDEAGKKREYLRLVRTYFGRKRLYRVDCTVRRARAKRVRDLFDQAVAGLVVEAEGEQVQTGLAFVSKRGAYTCFVPEGFVPVLPPAGSSTDMTFTHPKTEVSISVYGYAYDGILIDHVEEMVDYYRDEIAFEQEETRVLGGKGFTATVKRDGWTLLVAGTVQKRRVYRVHTGIPKDGDLKEGKALHEAFLKGFRITD